MKIRRIINVIVQGLAIIITLVCMIFCYVDRNRSDLPDYYLLQDLGIIVGVAFIFIGGYQVIHAFVTSILRLVQKQFNWLLGIYWILGLLYIIFWIVFVLMSNVRSMGDDEFFAGIISAWIPVMYYFIISVIDLVRCYKK